MSDFPRDDTCFSILRPVMTGIFCLHFTGFIHLLSENVMSNGDIHYNSVM